MNKYLADAAAVMRALLIVKRSRPQSQLNLSSLSTSRPLRSSQPKKNSSDPPTTTQQTASVQSVSEPEIPYFMVSDKPKFSETQIARAYEFSKLGVRVIGGSIGEAIRQAVWKRPEAEQSEKSKVAKYVASQKNAERIGASLCKLRGAALKIGQILSTMDEKIVPPMITEALERARAEADIMPRSQMNACLEKAYGEGWRQRIFSSFNENPIAAASIGQVHEAVLKNGSKVALKVQYPGVARSIDSDLNNFMKVTSLLGIFPKGFFLEKLIENTRNELHQECNYLLQAEKQMRYRAQFKDKRFNVPSVISELTTSEVLCSEFIEGVNIDDIRETTFPQKIRNELGSRLLELTLRELAVFSFMQTDPNPANFYYEPETDRLHLVDMGACRQYDRNFSQKYLELVKSASSGKQQEKQIALSIELGFLTGAENKLMTDAHSQALQTMGLPFATEDEFDFGKNPLMRKVFKLFPVMMKNRLRAPPQEVYSLHRKLSGCFLMCHKLGARVRARDLFFEIYTNRSK